MERVKINESIKILRTNIETSSKEDNSKILMFTSFKKNEGKKFIVSKLSVSFSEFGKKVLIIDGDLKNGKLNQVFNLENNLGLNDLIYEKKDYKKYLNKCSNNLDIIFKGSDLELNDELKYKEIKEILNQVKKDYDYVIIISPSLYNNSDSLMLSQLVNKVYVICRLDFTKHKELEKVKKMLDNINIKIDGLIVNKILR